MHTPKHKQSLPVFFFRLSSFFISSKIKAQRHNAFNLGDLQEDQTGDWWVYYGFNSNPTAVGKFPKSLFTGLADSTSDFAFGGYTNNARTQLTPPMGSGSSQTGSAASFSGLQYILQAGTVSTISGNLPSRVDNNRCYLVTPIADGKFFYGGPGGC